MRKNLIKAREKAGITQATLSARSKISRAFLCNIESGLKNPSLDVAGRIAKALGEEDVITLFANEEVTNVKNIFKR